jgi:hypothetical protein
LPAAVPTVAIFGAYGATGGVVARRLAEWGGCRLVLAGRHRERADSLAAELGDAADGAQADVYDRPAVEALCAASDLVVNCAGPYGEVGDRVARVAMEHGCDYVDPGGYDVLGPAMADAEDELSARRLTSVSSAGWLPGLDIVFLRYVDDAARAALDSVDRVSLYSGDRNCWTRTGALDIVQWVAGSAEPGFFADGSWVARSTLLSPRIHSLPDPAGLSIVMPVFKAELERFARERGHSEVRAYQAMLAPSLLMVLGLVRVLGRLQPERCAFAVQAAMRRQWARRGPAGLVAVVIEGRLRGRRSQMRGVVREGRGYWTTGIVAATAAERILGGHATSTGSVPICDAFEAAGFMAALAERGIGFELDLDGRPYAADSVNGGAVAERRTRS